MTELMTEAMSNATPAEGPALVATPAGVSFVRTRGPRQPHDADPDISIVIVGTNERDLIERCLTSIYNEDQGVSYEVIVVDNLSTDDTSAMIAAKFPAVQVIYNTRRYPRSANNNIGTAATRGAHILWLDPDTVVRPGALRKLLAFLREHPDAGAVGPQLVSEDGSYQLSARTFQGPAEILVRRSPLGRTAWGRSVLRRHLLEDWAHDSIREVDWLQGAAMLIPRPVMDMVGPNDACLKRYVEDMDWCFRARKLGWKIYYTPDARIEHLYRRASAGSLFNWKKVKTVYYHLSGWARFYNKHFIYPGVKRLVDILFASVVLLLSSPFVLILAACIRLETPGPALFRQTRVGKNGRLFTLYKFRSMCHGAAAMQHAIKHMNEVSGPVFKIRKDPRLTAVGAFIRRFSIDEFPQLINVLKGDMSLVGPRPPLPSEVAQYTDKVRRRLLVKPGLTGLWQVSGRSDIPFDHWIDMDLKYISEQSPMLDLAILIKTIPAVLSGRGAY